MNARRGNQNAIKHGATTDVQIRPLARVQRRRVLRQLRLSPRDLDAIGRGYLDQYVRLVSKVDLLDTYLAQHGLLRADGEPQPCLRLYTSLANSARLALTRLEDHLRKRHADDTLEAYVHETYGMERRA